jgi:hypothetical protein
LKDPDLKNLDCHLLIYNTLFPCRWSLMVVSEEPTACLLYSDSRQSRLLRNKI